MIVKVPCSPEQEDVIVDHLMYGAELGLQPDERAWILNHIRKQYGGQVISANLDLDRVEWVVQVTE